MKTSDPSGRAAAEAAEAEHWARLYGRWQPLSLREAREFMAGFSRPWWVVGGWSIELFTGTARDHSDVDLSILACDVPALRSFLAHRWHLWNLYRGDLRPLTGNDTPIFAPDSQLWVREHGDAPWVIDIPITPDRGGMWINKRLPGHVAPLQDVTYQSGDGVRYLRPEIALFFKARTRRAKDEADLQRTLPLLADRERGWLADSIAAAWGRDHAWLDLL